MLIDSANPSRTIYRMSYVGPASSGYVGKALNAQRHVSGVTSTGFGLGSGFFYDGVAITTFETPTGAFPEILDMNDQGHVVDSFESTNEQPEAFSWTRNADFVRLAPLSSKVTRSIAYDVNQSGQVVGTVYKYDGTSQGLLWSPSTGMVTSFGEQGTKLIQAYRINDKGYIAGEVLDNEKGRVALVHIASGAVTFAVPSDSGNVSNIPLRPNLFLNDAGDVSGALDMKAFFSQPLTTGQFIDLGSIVREGILKDRPNHDPSFGTYVSAMNEKGQLTVNIDIGVRSHYWGKEDGFIGIWSTGSDDYSLISINNQGVAVGWSDPEYAIAWSKVSGPLDLSSRVQNLPAQLRLRHATAINDKGQSLALAEHRQGDGTGPVLLSQLAD